MAEEIKVMDPWGDLIADAVEIFEKPGAEGMSYGKAANWAARAIVRLKHQERLHGEDLANVTKAWSNKLETVKRVMASVQNSRSADQDRIDRAEAACAAMRQALEFVRERLAADCDYCEFVPMLQAIDVALDAAGCK